MAEPALREEGEVEDDDTSGTEADEDGLVVLGADVGYVPRVAVSSGPGGGEGRRTRWSGWAAWRRSGGGRTRTSG